MKTARQRVLDYIQTHRAVTTAELCQALSSTEANIRHHLGILQQQGLVQVIGSQAAGERRPSKRGRPARIFGPVAPSSSENLAELAAALLDEILPGLPPEQRAPFLAGVAGRLAAWLSDTPKMQAQPGSGVQARSETLTARLYSTVERLNRANYQARWEARPDAPRVILGRCPFGNLPQRNPKICQVDGLLLEILLGVTVEQVKRLEKDARGLPHCMFRLT